MADNLVETLGLDETNEVAQEGKKALKVDLLAKI